MSDYAPVENVKYPLRAGITIVHRIGEKCVVTEVEDGWICAHGTDDVGRLKKGEVAAFPDVSPLGAPGIDETQSRIYFFPDKHGCAEGSVHVVLSTDTYFKSSSKGRRSGKSISFDNVGNPVPEVLLLFALKTKHQFDRHMALSAWSSCYNMNFFPTAEGVECDDPTFGDIFEEMQSLGEDVHRYHLFIGYMMANNCSSHKGSLSKWAAWEKVADIAVEERRSRIEKYSGEHSPDFDAMLLLAVKDAADDAGGLPSQKQVQDRWEALGGRGDWRDNRRKLGFDWLPTTPEWKKGWVALYKKLYVENEDE